MVLSENSIELAALSLAALYVGVPLVPGLRLRHCAVHRELCQLIAPLLMPTVPDSDVLSIATGRTLCACFDAIRTPDMVVVSDDSLPGRCAWPI